MLTYNTDQAWAWPEMGLVQDVLRDETLIPFHVVLDVAYSETAHLADLILPWTTWMERWDIDSRPPLGLVDHVGLRQPLVEPLGEAKDVRDIFPELARRIGGGMEQYFPWKTTEEYLEEYFKRARAKAARMSESDSSALDATAKAALSALLAQVESVAERQLYRTAAQLGAALLKEALAGSEPE